MAKSTEERSNYDQVPSPRFAQMVAVLNTNDTSNNNSTFADESLEIMKSTSITNDQIDSKSPPPPPRNSITRELIKKAREAANQKFAQTINKPAVEATNPIKAERKLVLKGEESPAWHGALIKTKLKRPDNPVKLKSIKPSKHLSNSNCTNSSASKSLFEFYKEVRKEYEDFREIEASRLQRRLEKLSDFPKESDSTKFEEFEKKIVPWQLDSSTNCCYLCSEEFTLLNRRHHCRLCGRIICGSFASKCLENIPIKLADEAKELKSCGKCYKTLFKKKFEGIALNFNEKRMQTIYKKIKSLREQLLETIPRFNQYLLEESVTVARPLKEWHQDAWALRDTLILYSVHFRSLMQELAELCETEALDKPVFRVMAGNLKRAANEFIQRHMFTLQIINFEAETSAKRAADNETKDDKQLAVTRVQKQPATTLDWKNLFPSLLNELFNSSLEPGSFEFYTPEGDLISLDDPKVLKDTLRNQEIVLKEQLEQLNKELSRTKAGNEDTASIEAAIEDIKRELNRLKRLK